MRNILLVDDDVFTQWAVTEEFSDAGYNVTGVCHGFAALALLNVRAADFDLLLTDINLPDGLSGMDVAAQWRRCRPGCPVIYASGYDADIVGSLPDGELFISKPFSTEQLLRAVENLLAERMVRTAPVHAAGPQLIAVRG